MCVAHLSFAVNSHGSVSHGSVSPSVHYTLGKNFREKKKKKKSKFVCCTNYGCITGGLLSNNTEQRDAFRCFSEHTQVLIQECEIII